MVVEFHVYDTEGRTFRTIGYAMNFPNDGVKTEGYTDKEMTDIGINYFKTFFPEYADIENDSSTFRNYILCKPITFIDEHMKTTNK